MSTFLEPSIISRLLAKVTNGRAFHDRIVESKVIDAGGDFRGPPAIMLTGQLDRVRKCAFDVPTNEELTSCLTGIRKVEPTIRHELHNAQINGWALHHSRSVNRLRWDGAPMDKTDVIQVDADILVLRNSMQSIHYFGHWLGDDNVTQFLAQDLGPVIAMGTPRWRDKAVYRDFFQSQYLETQSASARTLFYFQDTSQTANKIARIQRLRSLVSTKITPRLVSDITYIRRGSSGANRGFVQEEKLLDILTKRDVNILHAESTPPSEMLAILTHTKILIGLEGSELCHGIFTIREGGGVIALQPPQRFFNAHMDWLHPLGMRYGIVVGTEVEGGFVIDAEELVRTLDLVQRATS
jgi:hypothetical protein